VRLARLCEEMRQPVRMYAQTGATVYTRFTKD